MQMDEGDERLLEALTERIIGCAFRIANALGHGFVEKVYENAFAHEMRKCGLGVVQQRGIVGFYVLSRPSLIGRTIPFIPAYPLHPP